MHLACYTQEQIAEAVGMTSQGVGKVLKQIPNLEFVSNLGDFSNIAALASVELSKGGAGKKGGLREYARRVGRAQPRVTEWVQAARVATQTDTLTYQLFDLTTHLAAIHAAPQELLPVFVDGPIGPSVSQSDAPIGASVSQSDAGRAVQANLPEQAKQRRLATLKRGEEMPVRANWPERESGRARDHVANLFGVSPRSVERTGS